MMLLTTTMAWADTETVSCIDAYGDEQTVTATVLTGGGATTLSGGWYVVKSDISYTGTINFTGDGHLILADGATMTVTKNTINNKDIGAIVADNLTICGQALGTGKLNVSCTANGGNGLYAYNDITINGGNVTTSVSQYGIRAEYGYFTINGGNVSASGWNNSISAGYGITINGGNVSASGTYNGIYVQSGTITLGWRNATDHIYASSYSNDDVSIKSGQKLTDGTNIYDGNTCAIDGKTLYPYIEDLALAANPHDGNYWTTFYCGHTGYKIDNTENAWAYTAEYDDTNSQLTLHKLGKVIPKQTAVILVGSDNSISMTASTDAPENTVSNDLHGEDVRTLKSTLGDGTFYVMGKVNDVFGFYQYTAQYMPARKAYLLVSGSAAPGLKVVFDDGETSGLSEMRNEKGEMRNEKWLRVV